MNHIITEKPIHFRGLQLFHEPAPSFWRLLVDRRVDDAFDHRMTFEQRQVHLNKARRTLLFVRKP